MRRVRLRRRPLRRRHRARSTTGFAGHSSAHPTARSGAYCTASPSRRAARVFPSRSGKISRLKPGPLALGMVITRTAPAAPASGTVKRSATSKISAPSRRPRLSNIAAARTSASHATGSEIVRRHVQIAFRRRHHRTLAPEEIRQRRRAVVAHLRGDVQTARASVSRRIAGGAASRPATSSACRSSAHPPGSGRALACCRHPHAHAAAAPGGTMPPGAAASPKT